MAQLLRGEADRVVALSAQAEPGDYEGFTSTRIRRLADLESILALDPDLVIASALGSDRSAARLQEAGVSVLALPPPSDLSTFCEAVLQIGRTIGETQRSRDFAMQTRSRFDALVARGARVRGLYLSVHGAVLYGGTEGSSYGDVLRAGGIIDVAAETGLRGYPQYSAERLIELAPDVLVVPSTSADPCALESLRVLPACENASVIRVAGKDLDDAGLGILRAAEALRAHL